MMQSYAETLPPLARGAAAVGAAALRLVNMAPRRLSDDLVYGVVSLGRATAIAVRDRGDELRLVGDLATTGDLWRMPLGSGEYATCLSEKVFRLGEEPAGPLTYDVEAC